MKLAEAKLASQPNALPQFQRMFNELKELKPDLTLDDLALFAATIQAEYMNDRRDREYVAYLGLAGTKDNPKEINSILESFDDPDDPEHGSWQEIIYDAKQFLKIK